MLEVMHTFKFKVNEIILESQIIEDIFDGQKNTF